MSLPAQSCNGQSSQAIDRLIHAIVTERDFGDLADLSIHSPAIYRRTLTALGRMIAAELIKKIDNKIALGGAHHD